MKGNSISVIHRHMVSLLNKIKIYSLLEMGIKTCKLCLEVQIRNKSTNNSIMYNDPKKLLITVLEMSFEYVKSSYTETNL